MTAAAVDFIAQQSEEQRRRMRQALLASVGAHFVVAGILFFAPSPAPAPFPDVISIDLLAPAPPSAAPAPAPKPAAAPKPPPEPKAAPEPVPVPEAPAPPVPKTTVLPKDAPEKVTKAKPTPALTRPPKPKELSAQDAMAQLRAELGETAPEAPPSPAKETSEAPPAEATTSSGQANVSPELAAWSLATLRHVRQGWIVPQEFRDRGLVTYLSLELSATGAVRGEPKVVRSSGDPYFDDSAVRALKKVSPLPAPPSAGTWPFRFRSED